MYYSHGNCQKIDCYFKGVRCDTMVPISDGIKNLNQSQQLTNSAESKYTVWILVKVGPQGWTQNGAASFSRLGYGIYLDLRQGHQSVGDLLCRFFQQRKVS